MIATTLGTAVIGAGPYGLSIAAHLEGRGIEHRIFGQPMATWLNHMPKSMLLKSDGFASNLSAPDGDHTIRSYCLRNGVSYDDYDVRVALATFIDYALDFQRRYVPEIDQRTVTSLAFRDGCFTLQLEGGERIRARRVVLAVGISHFDYVPASLGRQVEHWVTHSSAWKDVSQFLNSDVTIIGGGSSALELAAGLHDAGAKVRLVVRGPGIRFDDPTPRPDSLSAWQRIRHPRSGLGPNLKSWLYCQYPHLFRYLPSSTRLDILGRHLGPASPWYLRTIVQKATLLTGHEVESTRISDSRVHLRLRNGTAKPVALSTDHVIAATGYRVDLQRLRFMDANLRNRIRTAGPMPVLSRNFESSVPGLYFAGLAAAGSFGPLLRFVHGTEFAARRITAHIAASGDT
jgi:thioredoxin reductase